MGIKTTAMRQWVRNLPRQLLTGKSHSLRQLVRRERERLWAEQRRRTETAFLNSFSPWQRTAWGTMGKVKKQLARMSVKAKQYLTNPDLQLQLGLQAQTLHAIKTRFNASLSQQQKQWLGELEE